jgi:CO/xanthine dehydrogenase FAD-binding subunit
MPDNFVQVFSPMSLSELSFTWNKFPQAVLLTGGTSTSRNKKENNFFSFENILSLHNIKELQKISRTEHYIEIGATVTIADLLSMGKLIPEALTKTAQDLAAAQTKNMTTLGGQICGLSSTSIQAALLALDAQYELYSAITGNSKWISAARFLSVFTAENKEHELLTKIRLPLEKWDFVLCNGFTENVEGSQNANKIIFLSRIQKNILRDVHIVMTREDVMPGIMRDKDIELFLEGNTLPLEKKIQDEFLEKWEKLFGNDEHLSAYSKQVFINYLEYAIQQLS